MKDISLFGKVWCASGARGFLLGDRYWPRKIFEFFGFGIDETTEAAKTLTLNGQEGNMPLNEKFEPKNWFPGCIIFQWLSRNGLNAVGLSGPSLKTALNTGL